MKILNLTQHPATDDQKIEGVFDLEMTGDNLARSFGLRPNQFGYFTSLADCLTFDHLPTDGQMWTRAVLLAAIAARVGAPQAMIGGLPCFMPPLQKALAERGIQPVYAFSKRESVEKVIDGAVVKTSVFKHLGMVVPSIHLGMDEDDLSFE